MALAVGFSLTAIASIGSAAALLVFTLVTAGHLRVSDVDSRRYVDNLQQRSWARGDAGQRPCNYTTAE